MTGPATIILRFMIFPPLVRQSHKSYQHLHGTVILQRTSPPAAHPFLRAEFQPTTDPPRPHHLSPFPQKSLLREWRQYILPLTICKLNLVNSFFSKHLQTASCRSLYNTHASSAGCQCQPLLQRPGLFFPLPQRPLPRSLLAPLIPRLDMGCWLLDIEIYLPRPPRPCAVGESGPPLRLSHCAPIAPPRNLFPFWPTCPTRVLPLSPSLCGRILQAA